MKTRNVVGLYAVGIVILILGIFFLWKVSSVTERSVTEAYDSLVPTTPVEVAGSEESGEE